jgi:hypothetical protein
MNKYTNEQLIKYLSPISNKIQVGFNEIFHQYYINEIYTGIVNIVLSTIFILISLFLLKLCIKSFKKENSNYCNFKAEYGLGIVLTTILIFIGFWWFFAGLEYLILPKFLAINDILSTIGH